MNPPSWVVNVPSLKTEVPADLFALGSESQQHFHLLVGGNLVEVKDAQWDPGRRVWWVYDPNPPYQSTVWVWDWKPPVLI